jgi:hypothetical protein
MKKDFKIQTIPITLGSVCASIITNIIGYIALYFFKPIWDRFVKWLNK